MKVITFVFFFCTLVLNVLRCTPSFDVWKGLGFNPELVDETSCILLRTMGTDLQELELDITTNVLEDSLDKIGLGSVREWLFNITNEALFYFNHFGENIIKVDGHSFGYIIRYKKEDTSDPNYEQNAEETQKMIEKLRSTLRKSLHQVKHASGFVSRFGDHLKGIVHVVDEHTGHIISNTANAVEDFKDKVKGIFECGEDVANVYKSFFEALINYINTGLQHLVDAYKSVQDGDLSNWDTPKRLIEEFFDIKRFTSDVYDEFINKGKEALACLDRVREAVVSVGENIKNIASGK